MTAAAERTATIVNQKGLHARAAAKLAQLAGQFKSKIEVSRSGVTVSALSIMGLMMLAAAPGMSVDIRARGPDADAAAESIAALIAGGFGEELAS